MLPLDFPAEKKNALLQTVNRNFFILLLISLREGIFIIFSFTYFALSKESIFPFFRAYHTVSAFFGSKLLQGRAHS
ncbi:hypothetical protein D7V94_08545 [Parablautia intestinalis]|uniref:Uncharacterized protein n=1 Tax=Parablautia intestinalis TaxID=2320100 RepID=A0A3A9AM85_9FIRM|nr:hypothetical protein D7V94_08545 [Parablautia intestinalis]